MTLSKYCSEMEMIEDGMSYFFIKTIRNLLVDMLSLRWLLEQISCVTLDSVT